MKLKKGITVFGLKPEIMMSIPVVNSVFAKYGVDAVITSAAGEKHKARHSLHYTGQALDWRTRDVQPSQLGSLVQEIRDGLTEDYQVILELDHIHTEYQPIK